MKSKLDCIKNLGRRNTKHRKPKNTPWKSHVPGLFKSHSDGVMATYYNERFTKMMVKKAKGQGTKKFPK